MQKKVFGIGFHKTATSSLGSALSILGYRVCGAVGVRDPDIESNVYALVDKNAAMYDAFHDHPWSVTYKYLDKKYPDSNFILTIRNDEDWLASALAHFGSADTPMRQWVYGEGHPEGNEALYLARYRQHEHEVRDYFQDRPAKLLVMDITSGDAWPALCNFLDKPFPADEFPFKNSASARDINV